MTDYIKELYLRETKQLHGPLDFDDIPTCAKACQAYETCLSALPKDTGELLDEAVFDWIEACNQACFMRGFQLGLQMMKWAAPAEPVL